MSQLAQPVSHEYERSKPVTADVAPGAARLVGTPWARLPPAVALYSLLWRVASRINVRPNRVTLLSLAFALGAGGAIAFQHNVLAAALLLISGVLDLVDGIVARARGIVSRGGALLDSVVDRAADAVPLMALAFVYREAALAYWSILGAALGGYLVSYTGARAKSLGLRLPRLFPRRTERLLALVVVLLSARPGASPGLVLYGVTFLIAAVSLLSVARSLRAMVTKDGKPGAQARGAAFGDF